MSPGSVRVRLDLNNQFFQRDLFKLEKERQRSILVTLRKLAEMTWDQVYRDHALRWELILSRTGERGERIYSLCVGKEFRSVVCRDGDWLRFISLHPDHDSAYD